MHYEINACAMRLIHLMRGRNFSFNAGNKHDKYSVTACTLNKLKQKETPIFALYKSNHRSHNPQEILIKITTIIQLNNCVA